MKITKQFLSVFLALIMIISIIPMSSITVSAAETSGTCGDNLTWNFNETTGTLTISGTGAMDDFSAGNSPWATYEDDIVTVVVDDGVTRIGSNSFYSCSSLTNVILSDTITSIGDSSFCECTSLISINIPDSTTDIGSYAFDSCSSLKNVTLSKSIISLGGRAFGYTAIETIEIPKSLETCSEVLRQGVWEWSYVLDDVEYWLKGGPFYCCENLETATFETGTTQIASSLFRGCTGLKEVEIPDTVTNINGSAFAECLRLESIIIGDAVKSIGDSAFAECIALKSVDIPDSVTDIASYAFDSCTSLKNVTFSNSLLTLGGRAFGYTAIESVNIPKSLESCSQVLRQGVWEWSYDLDGVEYWLKGGPFYCCEELETVTIESGITNIPSFLFRGCTGLKKIQIPDTVTVINDGAFAECFRLTDVTIGNVVTKINNDAFLECISLEEITIPDSVTEIGYTVFRDCSSLKTIEIPDTIINMGHGVFLNCESLTAVEFSENVEIMPKDTFKGCSSLKEAILPEKTKEIGACAFQNCVALEKVYIPQSTKTIGNQAFMGCEALSDVTIADYSITSIGTDVFKDCPGLVSVVLPKGLTTIGSQAFMNDTGLTSVTIPESVTSIDSTAFSYPKKTTIYGKTGSYAETFANEYGFTFVDISIPAEGIILKDGAEIVNLDRGETYRAEFEVYPENANDVVTLTASNTKVKIEGMDIYAQSAGDTVVTATTSSGMTYEFTVHIRDAKSIEITSNPDKMTYALGEEFDNTGMVVTVNYSDNTTEVVTDYVVSGFDSSAEGNRTVTVQWTSPAGSTYKKTFTVEVVDTSPKVTGIYIDTLPNKVEYDLRESLDTTGLVVMANYTDGSTAEVTGYTVSGYNALKSGEQTITVTYGEFTTTFKVYVDVSAKTLESITISTYPSKTTYYIGDSLDTTGLVLTLTYSDGSTATATSGFTTSGFSSTSVGSKTVTVTYNGKTATFTVTVINDNTETISGVCGDNLTWTFDESTGTLTISGTGEMYNYYDYESYEYPWESFKENITTVVVDEGVTTIGVSAFSYCESITQVTISDTVKTIGDTAFVGCRNLDCIIVDENNEYYSNDEFGVLFNKDKTKLIRYPNGNTRTEYNIPDTVKIIGEDAFDDNFYLTDITIPYGVTTIEFCAFADCCELNDIVIPNSVKTIGDWAFSCCHNFVDVVIPESVEEIGISAFGACEKLERITVDENNSFYSNDENGVLFNKDKTLLMQFPVGNVMTHYTIPDSVIIIDDYAFQLCKNLTSVTIPYSVKTIGYSAFEYCDAIEDVYYGSSEEKWNDIAIGDYNSSLLNANIHFENEPIIPENPDEEFVFSIQEPSRTTIRHKDGIKLHANVEGTAPAGSYVEWTASNGKFKTEEINDGNSLKIVSDSNGKTTFTATLYSADGEALATDSIEMTSKAGFFDKIGSFFRSLFGGTKIYEY